MSTDIHIYGNSTKNTNIIDEPKIKAYKSTDK